jgi:hypothetical protein
MQYWKDIAQHNRSFGPVLVQKNQKYRAVIYIDGRNVHLGYFDDLSAASLAVDFARVQHHGNFRRTNSPLFMALLAEVPGATTEAFENWQHWRCQGL